MGLRSRPGSFVTASYNPTIPTLPTSNTTFVEYLIVSGGGSGGGRFGGGGGGGGLLTGNLTVNSGFSHTVTVGVGGTGTYDSSTAPSSQAPAITPAR